STMLEAITYESGERLHEMGQVRAEPVEAGKPLQRALVHIERAINLDLEAVAILGRASLPSHDLDALVPFVDTDVVAEPAQEAGNEVGEIGCAGRAIAIAEHKIAMLVARAAVGRH